MDRLHHTARKLITWFHDQGGASIIEYALAVALIAVVSIGALSLVAEKTLTQYDCVSQEVDSPDKRKAINDKVKSNTALEILEKKYADSCL